MVLVGMCLDGHAQVMSRKACQKKNYVVHAIMHKIRSEDLIILPTHDKIWFWVGLERGEMMDDDKREEIWQQERGNTTTRERKDNDEWEERQQRERGSNEDRREVRMMLRER